MVVAFLNVLALILLSLTTTQYRLSDKTYVSDLLRVCRYVISFIMMGNCNTNMLEAELKIG